MNAAETAWRALVVATAVVAASACSAKPVATECRDLVATLERVITCPALSASARTSLQASATSMRTTLEMLDRPDTELPPELVKSMRDACRAQLRSVREDAKLEACAK